MQSQYDGQLRSKRGRETNETGDRRGGLCENIELMENVTKNHLKKGGGETNEVRKRVQ